MNKNWIDIIEAVKLFNKSEMTIRRFINKHKNNIDAVRKDGKKYLINYKFISLTYQSNNDIHNDQVGENIKDKKDAMQIAYNSEIIKKKDEQLDAKDKLIGQLINKKTPILRHSTFWTAVSSIIALVLILTFGYFYRLEFQKQYKEKYQLLKTSLEKEIGLLRDQNEMLHKTMSKIKQNSKMLLDVFDMQKKELLEQNKKLNEELIKSQSDIWKN
jgi:hypothetical protein